jgi:hypothetical protein
VVSHLVSDPVQIIRDPSRPFGGDNKHLRRKRPYKVQLALPEGNSVDFDEAFVKAHPG